MCGVQLPSLGVDPKCITFVNVTMESDKFVCVRETGAANSVVIIDMAQPNSPLRRPITADSALMNPNSKIIALKASAGGQGDSLQIFNLETKSKVKSFQIAQSVPFWKWISPTKLGLVTATTVYHWDMNVRPRHAAAQVGMLASLLICSGSISDLFAPPTPGCRSRLCRSRTVHSCAGA